MTLSGQTIKCVAGETWDSIALSVYGDEKYACDLLCANPALSRKFVFAGGEVLSLPVVEIPEAVEDGSEYTNEIAPWKEADE